MNTDSHLSMYVKTIGLRGSIMHKTQKLFTSIFGDKIVSVPAMMDVPVHGYKDASEALDLALRRLFMDMYKATLSGNPLTADIVLHLLTHYLGTKREYLKAHTIFNALVETKSIAYISFTNCQTHSHQAVITIPCLSDPTKGPISVEHENNLIENYIYRVKLRILNSIAVNVLSAKELEMLDNLVNPKNSIIEISLSLPSISSSALNFTVAVPFNDNPVWASTYKETLQTTIRSLGCLFSQKVGETIRLDNETVKEFFNILNAPELVTIDVIKSLTRLRVLKPIGIPLDDGTFPFYTGPIYNGGK